MKHTDFQHQTVVKVDTSLDVAADEFELTNYDYLWIAVTVKWFKESDEVSDNGWFKKVDITVYADVTRTSLTVKTNFTPHGQFYQQTSTHEYHDGQLVQSNERLINYSERTEGPYISLPSYSSCLIVYEANTRHINKIQLDDPKRGITGTVLFDGPIGRLSVIYRSKILITNYPDRLDVRNVVAAMNNVYGRYNPDIRDNELEEFDWR